MCDQERQNNPESSSETERGHYVAPHVRKRIGEALALILYFAIDGFGFWPEHHGWALVIAVAGVSVICFAELQPKAWIAITGALACVSVVVYFIAGPALPPETEAHGWLMPGDEATPVNGCTGRTLPANALLFIAGTNGAWTTSTGTTLLDVANTDVLSFRRKKNGGLLFDMDMYDKQGNLILRIDKNEFHLIPGMYSYPNRSHDRSQLIVYDKKGYVLFYIGYLNRNTVRIAGQFYGADGTEVQIDPYNVIEVNNKSEDTMDCAGDFRKAGFFFSRNPESR